MSLVESEMQRPKESLLDVVFRHRFGISFLVCFVCATILAAHGYYLNTYMEQPTPAEEIRDFGDRVISSDKAAKRLMRHLIANPAPNRRQWEAIEVDVLSTVAPDASAETCKDSLWSCLVNHAEKVQDEWIHEYDLK